MIYSLHTSFFQGENSGWKYLSDCSKTSEEGNAARSIRRKVIRNFYCYPREKGRSKKWRWFGERRESRMGRGGG